ncbi:Spermine synthase [Planctopirus limnophila DSM 3776]|uniref:Polyamine aminopropyltransferase n=2 Tax=Planctopirus limnophila TaxID=120 RepID=D5SNN1_PLAL2|nr:Spermine synthase [Planctopirus limnophila DSM 3776]
MDASVWIAERLSPVDIYQHGVSQMLMHKQTAFQEMSIVISESYGKALVLDGKWQTCTGDEFIYHELIAHLPCVLHGAPRKVLIAGGADGGAAREVLKWKTVEEVVIADLDGEVIDACREMLPEIHQGSLNDARVKIQVADAFDLIEASSSEYDVIIADLTDPIEEGPAYPLFTREFFEACRAALTPDGVLINQAGSMAPPWVRLLARVTKTMESAFGYAVAAAAPVPTYGSLWGLTIARTKPIETGMAPSKIDELVQEHVQGSLRMFDGSAFVAALQTPRYVRQAIDHEQTVYTLENPPALSAEGDRRE